MDSAESLASEVRRAVAGGTWFGPSLAELLAGVDAVQAATRVDCIPHSIWELVLHVVVWTHYAAYRFDGGTPRELNEANWPPLLDAGETAWATAVKDVFDACERAACSLATLSDEALDAVEPHTPTDAAGDPVTLRRIAYGLPQHIAYHAGQIALIKRVLESNGAPA